MGLAAGGGACRQLSLRVSLRVVDEIGPLPRKASSKVALIVGSLVLTFALCVGACWVAGSIANDALCGLGFEGC